MRRLTSLLLAVVMVFSMATNAFAASFAPELSVNEVKAGEDVTLTLKLDESLANMISLECYVYFNPNHFVLKSGAKGDDNNHLGRDLRHSEVFVDSADEHHYSINLVDPYSEGYTVNAGDFYTLTFTAKQDLTAEQASQFKLVSQDGRNLLNGTSEAVEVGLTAEVLDVTIKPEKIPVTGVTLNWSEKEISANGGEFKLSATITPSDATVQDVVWATSDANVATVTDGLVKAVGAGSADITATVDGVTATCVVTVYDPAAQFPFSLTVDGVDVEAVSDGEEFCVYGNKVTKYVVTVPAGAASMQIDYDYDDMTIEPDDSGEYLCEDEASFTVDLTNGYQFLDIFGTIRNEFYHLYIEYAEPETPAVSITLDKTELELSSLAGDYTLTATVTGTDSKVVWATSDATIAEVYDNNGGYVLAVAPGECDITATVDGVTATCHVTVVDPVIDALPYTITVDGTDVEAVSDGTEFCDYGFRLYKFKVTVPADAKIMHLSYDNESAYVFPDHGEEYLLEGGADCDVDLTKGYQVLDLWDAEAMDLLFHLHIEYAEPEKIPVTSVGLSETAIEMALNSGIKQLYATVTPDNATNKIVTWTSSDETVVTVVDGGNNMCILYTAGAGEAVITATADGVSASCAVTVYDPATQFPYTLSVNGEDLEVTPNGTTSSCLFGNQSLFDVTVPADATEMQITYDGDSMTVMDDSSGSPNILAQNVAEYTLDLTQGYAEIHLAENNVHRHVRINVAEPEKIPVTGVTLSVSEHTLDAIGGEFVLVATITPSNATNQEVVWATSDANVATVENGHIKAVGGGNCEITATVDGVTATCVVTVIDPRETFPFSVSVNGEDLEATYVGTEKCNTSGERALYEVTVPADATSMMIYYDGEAMIIQNEADKAKLAQKVSEYEVDLTAGYEKLCIREDNRIRYHLAINVAEPEAPIDPGYTFATSADVSAENGGTATVHVKVTGHSDETVTSYNAYDITLTFDSDKLEYVSYDGAVKSDGGSVTVTGNEIRIVGCGEDKSFGTEIVALTFETKAEGTADVTISKVQVSDKEEAVTEDIPEASAKHAENDANADATPDVSVVIVPFTVTKPDFISGEKKVLYGETYTFSYTDTANYTYSDLTVKVGGTVVTPTEKDGVYTITNVTGPVEITATQTANSYDVTKPENVGGLEKATYGKDYEFTVTPSANMLVDSVKVTLTGSEEEIAYTSADGKYIIAGSKIAGPITITVTEKPVARNTTITFEGIATDEIQGGSLTVTVPVGETYTFQLLKTELFTYTAKVGEAVLTESAETAGSYTIPGELVVANGITVQIEKNEIKNLAVDVNEYITLDGNAMFLVTAKWGDKVLAYGDETMIYSSKYTVTGQTQGAYCWLVLSTDELNTVDDVKAAAQAAIVEAAEGATATAVKYNYDINGTTKVDVNDAQLVYDMYNASYMEFTQNLPMLKFLEADMETDAKLDTKDVAAIISYIVSGSAN